jgi:hypothetical protein
LKGLFRCLPSIRRFFVPEKKSFDLDILQFVVVVVEKREIERKGSNTVL